MPTTLPWLITAGLYSVLLALLLVAVGKTRGARAGRFTGNNVPVGTLEAAFLAGGPGRTTDAAIATMAEDGRLAVGLPGIVAVRHAEARHPVEQAVLDACAAAPSGDLSWVRGVVTRSPAVQSMGDDLAERALIARPARLRPVRGWLAAHLFVAFLAFMASIPLTVLQLALWTTGWHSPPLLLTTTPALVLAVVAMWRYGKRAKNLLTPAGRRSLERYRTAGWGSADPGYTVAARSAYLLEDETLRTVLCARATFPRTVPRTAALRTGGGAGAGSTGADIAYWATVPTVWCGAGPGRGASAGRVDGADWGWGDVPAPGPWSGGSGAGHGGSGYGGGSSCGSGSSCGGSSSGGSSCGGGGGGSSCGGGGSSCGGGSS
ncbi:TIGR04222 domain-containing membrane protein [Streptomyces uncialis]|uniref:TIGR04222 domain-containing membrane protein n=1 Tax=Streptomyces uncialis TaxID=1048205 RepID=UPI00386855AE|nr:TIGR04222 domain-containing membrane protein [Streptomyces uncialis]